MNLDSEISPTRCVIIHYRDDHQRVLLHVSVSITGSTTSTDTEDSSRSVQHLHLYAAHLSLNEGARNNSYLAISAKMQRDGGYLQVACYIAYRAFVYSTSTHILYMYGYL